MVDHRSNIDTLREKLESGERGSNTDRDALLAFSNRLALLQKEYSDARHEKLLRHCVRMSEHADGSLTDALTDRRAAEAILRWINRTYDNEETNRDYRTAIRVFGRRVLESNRIVDPADTESDDRGTPRSIAWIPSGTSRSYDPAPDPSEMLEWDIDVKPMIDEAPNPRDKALLALAFDAGARSGELHALTNGDIADSPHGLTVRVDGKTGARTVTLIPSVPFVKRWRFEHHPRANEPDAPLWCVFETPEKRVSNRRFLDIFDAAATRNGVSKPTTPTAFRKSNASWLARQGASSHLIEDRQGRKRGSPVVSRYVARFGDAEGTRYAALMGRDVDVPDAADIDPPTCPRCGEHTPADEPACVWCGQAMQPGAAEVADRVRSKLQESMAREPNPDRRSALLSALQEIESNPEAANDLIETAIVDHGGSSP